MCSEPEVNISFELSFLSVTPDDLKYYESQQACIISHLVTLRDYIDSALL